MATITPRRGTTTPGAGALTQNELAIDTTNKRIYIGAADGSGTLIGSAPAGSDTQVQFNDGGVLGGDAGLTYNKTTDSLTMAGDLAVNGGDITTTTDHCNSFQYNCDNSKCIWCSNITYNRRCYNRNHYNPRRYFGR